MKVINASYQIMKPDIDDPNTYHNILKEIEECGRTAYKSENLSTDESAERMVQRLIRDGHESVLEHVNMRVKFIVDRGVSHELVRHRLASFTQESTRYCNYSQDKFGNEITVIKPCFFKPNMYEVTSISGTNYIEVDRGASLETKKYSLWYNACAMAERRYFFLLSEGCTPQEARTVLPNSLKTEVMMTANLREWRHILDLRAAGTTGKPHPQMLEVMVPLLNELKLKMPLLFADIQPMEVK